MKVTKQVHSGWKEMNALTDDIKKQLRHLRHSTLSLFGKYQYICKSKKAKISLIELPNYFRDGKDIWEIYCLEGSLFDDVERFDTKAEADKRIKGLLE